MNEGKMQPAGRLERAEIDQLFSQLSMQEVEQFYAAYQLWQKQQKAAQLQAEIHHLQSRQVQNAEQIQAVAPSAISLAALAQLRASGVEDIDLLDRMLERGEDWLDNTMQLLSRCEALNVIQGNYTQWCEHALEGAYEWMWSMDDAGLSNYFEVDLPEGQPSTSAPAATEEQLLRKLMSEPGDPGASRQTRPLPSLNEEATTPAITMDQPEPSSTEAAQAEIPPALAELLGTQTEDEVSPPTSEPAEESTDSIVEDVEQPEIAATEQSAIAINIPVEQPDNEPDKTEAEPLAEEEAVNAESDPADRPETVEPASEEELSLPATELPSSTDENEQNTDEPASDSDEQPRVQSPEEVSTTAEPDEDPEENVPAKTQDVDHEPVEVQDIADPAATASAVEEATEAEAAADIATDNAQEATEVEPQADVSIANAEDVTEEEPLAKETATAPTQEATSSEEQTNHMQWPYVYQEIPDPIHESSPVETGTPAESNEQQLEQKDVEEQKADEPHADTMQKTRGPLQRWLARIFGR
ncbi:hypothetical protein KDA_32490 [Dictyobacter alpinus]|uniref:Uncharacterized protein n=1 Tax=Dictyobacter alpinus TaxID=2014873 RepID=A0A402B8U3_9CHLR|nr:hypothetical protein [Dictyobacter alpinus]GCE27765.1 hypothetical protein KDA_32490 [Dictyobacter alpinus]